MLLKDFKQKKIKILHDVVAFKWLKINKWAGSSFIMPDSINDKGGEGRLGNIYTGEVISIGPDVKHLKPGMRFLIHEYDKLVQGDPWKEENVLFCEEGVTKALILTKEIITSVAGEITDNMMDEYEDY